MSLWNVGLTILNGVDLEPKLAPAIRESALRAGAHYVHVSIRSGGDLTATLAFEAASEREAGENGDVVINDIRPLLHELGVDSKRIIFSIGGWPEAP